MADQSVRVTNLPDSGSPARVAFDLMNRIAAAEPNEKRQPDPRAYFLNLYKECRAVTGY